MQKKEVKINQEMILHTEGLLNYHKMQKNRVELELEKFKFVQRMKKRNTKGGISLFIGIISSLGFFIPSLWGFSFLSITSTIFSGACFVQNFVFRFRFQKLYPLDMQLIHEKKYYIINNIVELEKELSVHQSQIDHLIHQLEDTDPETKMNSFEGLEDVEKKRSENNVSVYWQIPYENSKIKKLIYRI